MSTVAPFKLFVLGHPRIEKDGQTTALRLRRAIALLVYLAATRRPQGREVLAGLLWPEKTEQEARGRLRRTLYRFNEALGEALLAPDGDTLAVSPAAGLWVDSLAFEQQATRGLEAAADHQAVEQLQDAADLYADHFLVGFWLSGCPSWEEWLLLERERLRQLYSRVLGGLVAAHQARGEWELTIGYARQLLVLDALHEPAHRALIQALSMTGRTGDALRQYQECERLLRSELDLPPEAATAELYAAIRAQRDGPASESAGRQRPDPVKASPRSATSSVSTGLESPTPARQELPRQLTSFVGRAEERVQIAERLLDPSTRLLTLTGPGGIGKTRLALQVAGELASHFRDGVVFVGLAPVASVEQVAPAIAQALNLREEAGRPLLATICELLRSQEVLLLLDNLEHLPAVASPVGELLTTCSRLKVLATSRSRLRLRGEREWAVPPLTLPDPHQPLSVSALVRVPTVMLFADRARDFRPDFNVTPDNAADVAEICRQLDGLPLAIELAAARLKYLTPAALLAQLQQRLRLLTDGPRDLPARQRTLRDTIAWSYELLTEPEKALFRRLAVFLGGFQIEAAEAVGGPEGDLDVSVLGALVDHSLVRQDELIDPPRFTMLQTIREFALERLAETGELAEVQRRHAEYLADLVDLAEPRLRSGEEQVWQRRLDREHDNLRAALTWALRGGGDPLIGLRLCASLDRFWAKGEYHVQGGDWLAESLAANPAPSRVRARALLGAGHLARRRGDHRSAVVLLEQAVAAARLVGDRALLATAMGHLAFGLVNSGETARAETLAHGGLALVRACDDPWTIGVTLHNVGVVYHQRRQYQQAESLHRESLARLRSIGSTYGAAWSLLHLGVLALTRGEPEYAAELLEQSRSLHEQSGDAVGVAWALVCAGLAAVARADEELAIDFLTGGLERFRSTVILRGVPPALIGLAFVAVWRGNFPLAARLEAAVEGQREAQGQLWFPLVQDWHEDLKAALRRQTDEQAAGRTSVASTELSLDQAMDLGLTLRWSVGSTARRAVRLQA